MIISNLHQMQVVLLYICPTGEVTRPYDVCMYFKFIIIKMKLESNENNME